MSAERSERPGPGHDPAADPTPATRAGSGGLPSSGPSATAAGASATAVPRGGLARYVIAATLARTPTGGAVVGIVLLVTVHGGPEWSAGLLAACITAPHLLGPFVARSLDVVRDGRLVLVLACLLHGGLLIAAVLLYPLLPLLAVAALPVAAVGFAAVTGSEAAAAGTLTAAYGAGGLGASVLLMVRPLRTDADRSMTWFAASVAAMLALTLVSTTLWVALVLYAVVGACNSIFFATTLAARSEFAPDTARAQIFVWVGALKIASGAAGTALAGALIGPGVLLPVAVAAAVAGLAAALSQLERRRA